MLLLTLVTVALVVASLWIALVIVARQQPSAKLMQVDAVCFAAVRNPNGRVDDGRSTWSSKLEFQLIGPGSGYWTHFFFFNDETACRQFISSSQPDDALALRLEPLDVPAFLVGVLRALRLLHFAKTPSGELPMSAKELGGRSETLPSDQSIALLHEMSEASSLAMVNFLKYRNSVDGTPEGESGRAAYARYGAQAMRAVHHVGGQFIFAGRVTGILVAPSNEAFTSDWDDIAIMRYPDPLAILKMEQLGFYRAALSDRELGLDRTIVYASLETQY